MNILNLELVTFIKKKIDGKWKPVLLLVIYKHPLRFNKIKQLIPSISSRALTSAIKQLEEDDLITKENETNKFIITSRGKDICKHLRGIIDILLN